MVTSSHFNVFFPSKSSKLDLCPDCRTTLIEVPFSKRSKKKTKQLCVLCGFTPSKNKPAEVSEPIYS